MKQKIEDIFSGRKSSVSIDTLKNKKLSSVVRKTIIYSLRLHFVCPKADQNSWNIPLLVSMQCRWSIQKRQWAFGTLWEQDLKHNCQRDVRLARKLIQRARSQQKVNGSDRYHRPVGGCVESCRTSSLIH